MTTKIRIELDGLPVPLNSMYSNNPNTRGRFKVKEAKDLESIWKPLIRRQINDAKDWLPPAREDLLRVTIDLHAPRWIAKKGGHPSKNAGDIDGRVKMVLDCIFNELPGTVDDCQIFELIVRKLPGTNESTVVCVENLEVENFGELPW